MASGHGLVAARVGRATIDDEQVEHISVYQDSTALPVGGPSFQHLTQVDFYLDATTLLPAAISYNIHPDNDALVDIAVEVRFSDYRVASGTRIPFHIQRFLNGSLLLDIQLQNVSVNSGISASAFAIQ